MTPRPVTHERLRGIVARWRRQGLSHRDLAPLDPTGERARLAAIYRQCANDLDLALRDDATLHGKGQG